VHAFSAKLVYWRTIISEEAKLDRGWHLAGGG
jgi:hypothetical protein